MEASTPLSLFALIAAELGDRLAPIQATKATLVDVSHILEDLVIAERLPAMIFTGFQESSHWRAETARYRELAGVAHQICIFAGGNLPHEHDQRQINVRLRGPDPLRQEWFLLVLTERFAAVLCGRDKQAAAAGEGDRAFDTLWSFTPAIIGRTLGLLRDVVARERPDRLADLEAAIRRFPPPQPDAELMTRFTTRLIDDLTRQHQARLHAERLMAYESRLRALGQVLSSVAHELNNPLQSILGFASLIADDAQPGPTTQEDARHITEAAQRAQVIVQDLLQLARPVSDAFVATDLAGLVEQTLVFVRAEMRRSGVEIHVSAAPQLPRARANPSRIQQLLINLITNAIQALAPQPAPRTIEIALSPTPAGQVELMVRDNGPGVPQELHERIFEPFFTTKPVGEGTGLGLSIVHTIVAEHDGRVEVRAAPGGGAAFHVLLPTGAPEAPPRGPDGAASQARVLVIDDDPQVSALIERVLSRAGYAAEAEREPLRALERLGLERYDVVICDLLMPQISGVELYEHLAGVSPEQARRLIFITGDATRPAVQGFLQSTGQPYVLKPFTTQQLLAAVEGLLEARAVAGRASRGYGSAASASTLTP